MTNPEDSKPQNIVPSGSKYTVGDVGAGAQVAQGEHIYMGAAQNPEVAKQEGRDCLKRGQAALVRDDYASAKQELEKAIGILHEDELPKEVAKVRYLLALIQLDRQRPFLQTLPTMRSVESLLKSAIALHHSASYILTLAFFKLDFARNGLPQLVSEAHKLADQANQMSWQSEDDENFKVLKQCQPDLFEDYLE